MYRTIRKTAGTRTNRRLATKPRSLVSMAVEEVLRRYHRPSSASAEASPLVADGGGVGA
jgi:hypothetical protein